MNLLKVAFVLLSFSMLSQAKPFTDLDLEELISKEEIGLIYLWSPFMPLSEIGRDEITSIGNILGLRTTFVVDRFASGLIDKELFVLSSGYLQSMGVENHFPSIVMYKSGKILDSVIYGYEPDQKYLEQVLKNILSI